MGCELYIPFIILVKQKKNICRLIHLNRSLLKNWKAEKQI